MKRISIIVPVYNAEKYLDKCIKSILMQTYKEFELIIINDGSTDSSQKIIDKWLNKDRRIKAISQGNKGVSAARNEGLKLASGQWVTFVDADDYIKQDYYLKAMWSILKLENVDMLIYGRSTKCNKRVLHELSKEKIVEVCVDTKMAGGYPWNKFFRNDIIRKNKIAFEEDISICEDLLFCINYIQNIDNGHYLECDICELYNYRCHSGSATQRISIDKFKTALVAHEKILQYNFISNRAQRELRKEYNNIAIKCLLMEWKNEGKCRKKIRNKYISLMKKNKFYMSFKDYIKFISVFLFPHFLLMRKC